MGTLSPILEPTFSVAEVERATGINRQSIYRAVRRGELVALRVNGSSRGMRFELSALEDWKRSIRTQGSTSESPRQGTTSEA